MTSLDAATDRLFRAYQKHCSFPDQDTIFNYLNALHSFNDRLPKGAQVFASKQFVGLKALRNLFHHHEELLPKIKILSATETPLIVELIHVCLVDHTLVERAARLPRERHPDFVLSAFRCYGTVCDIEPAIFNVAVDAFEKAREMGLSPASEAYTMFAEAYENEESEGIEHRVEGTTKARAGDLADVLCMLMAPG